MPKSTEYPDLNFVQALSWENANRTSVQFLVMHTTEGSEHRTSAEDGASYDSWRTDGTSCHYFHDSDSTVQCVRTEDVAYSAFYNGNVKGIHHELCTQASDSVADWSDAYHTAMLDRAAKQAARDCAKWGIPPVRLTVAQMQNGKKGICGHADVTNAYPQDPGNHTDPGKNFPWTGFINRVKSYMSGESDMELNDKMFGGTPTDSWKNRYPGIEPTVQNGIAFAAYDAHDAEKGINELKTQLAAQKTQLDQIIAALAKLPPKA